MTIISVVAGAELLGMFVALRAIVIAAAPETARCAW